MKILFAIFLIAVSISACVVTKMDRVSILDPNPMGGSTRGSLIEGRVLLLIPPDVKEYVWQGKVTEGFEGRGRLKIIPFGEGIVSGFKKGCAQVFTTCRVIESMPIEPDYDAVIAPRVSGYTFQWDDVPVSTYNLRVTGSLSMEVRTMTQGGVFVTRSYDKTSQGEMIARVTYQPDEFARADRSAAEKAMAAIIQDVFRDIQAETAITALPVVSSSAPQVASRPTVATHPRPLPLQEALPAPIAKLSATAFSSDPLSITYTRGEERPNDIAVIIGNADYKKQGKDIPDVIPAYADAEGIKRYVTEALGVREGNIIDLRDATGSKFVEVFGSKDDHRGQLFDWVKPGIANVFVYYAGHGAPGSEDGSALLVPTDANAARIELSGYALSDLYRNLGKIPAHSITVVLEACFSGASQAGSVISKASPVYIKAKTPPVPTNVTVIAAGTPNQLASWEEDESHGLFTKYFLKGMSGEADANGDGTVGLEELGRYLKDTLTYYARRYYGRDQTAVIVVGG